MAGTATATGKKPGLLINRNYGFLWFGQAISLIGDEVFDLTLVVWIASKIAMQPNGMPAPWAPEAVSGALVAATAPFFLLGPLAGVFVDRWNKRATMLRMDAARAILIALLILASGLAPLPFFAAGKPTVGFQLGMIYGIVFLASVCAQFFNPSRMALIGDVVSDEYRAQASGLGQTSQAFAAILGPPLAAPLLFGFGVYWALIINALSFVASFVCILAVKAPEAARSVAAGQRGNVGQEFRAGLRFALGNRVISTLMAVAFIAQIGAGSLIALNVFFITQNLHAPVQDVGFMSGAFGFGAIAGAIIFSGLAHKLGEARVFAYSALAMALLMFGLSRVTNLWVALGIIGVVGIFQAALNVSLGPLLLRVTPRELVGRVVAVLNPTAMLANLISIGLAGYLAGTVLYGFHHTLALGPVTVTFGPIDTIFSAGSVLFLLGALLGLARLRGTDGPAPGAGAVETAP